MPDGIEALFGADPGIDNSGLVMTGKSGNAVTLDIVGGAAENLYIRLVATQL